jgi:hypothetical protein
VGSGSRPAPGLVIGGVDLPSLTFLEGNGDGTFSTPAFVLVVEDIDGGFVDVSVADLNGDGRDDVTAVPFVAPQVVVALGDAPFHVADPELIDIGAKPTRLIVRDVTGDAIPDAVVATDTGIVLLRGRGDGSFAGAESIGSGDAVKDIAILDVNGDRLLDVVAAVPREDAVRVYLAVRGGGFVAGPEASIEQPLALAVGEFTSDTRLDVAVFADRSAEVVVLQGTSSGLRSPFVVASGIAASRLFAADVNGDARADLVASDAVTGSTQTLAGSDEVPFVVVSTSGAPRSGLVVADFDNDGLADLVSLPPRATDPQALPDPLPPAPRPCRGDCNHDRSVGTDELIVAVRLALGDQQFTCPALDQSGDASIGIDDLITALRNALVECPPSAQ